MAKQNINVGTTANDKKGDSLRAAFQKVNANFTELYTELGLVNDITLSLGAFEFAGSTLSTTDSTAIVIDQATTVTSNLTVGGDILPQTAYGGDLGSSTLPWRSLYVSNNTIFLGGTALSVNGAGNLLVNGSLITGGGSGSSLVNGNKTVSLDTDGNLTLPTQGKIMPVGDVNSFLTFNYGDDVELKAGDNLYLSGSVATIRTNGNANQWIFGTDGTLTAPGTITASNLIVDAGNITFLGNGSGIQGAMSFNLSTNNFTNNWNFSQDGTLSLPNNGSLTFPDGTTQTTAWTGFSVAADDSTQRLINADEVVKFIGAGGITTASDAEGNITITGSGGGVSSLVNGARTASLGSDGALTIPGDIKSNGNINIDINLADSTLRRWQFGEDGDLTFPNGVLKIAGNTISNYVANDMGANGSQLEVTLAKTVITNGVTNSLGGGPSLIGQSLFEVSTNGILSSFQVINTLGEGESTLTSEYLTELDYNSFKIGQRTTNDLGDGSEPLVAFNGWTFSTVDQQQALTFPDGTTQTTAAQAFSFSVAADDSTQRAISNKESIKFIGAGGITTASDAEGNITINYVQGDIRSDSNINIDINLADSTLRRWQFGEDGDTVFPNNVSINYSGGNIQYPRIIADSGKAFSVQGQGTSGSAALSWTVNPDAAGQYAAVAVTRAGGGNLATVVLQAQSDSGDVGTVKLWRFDETGVFTLPAGGVISEGGGISGAIRLTPAGGANANQALLIYPTGTAEGDHIHLTAGGGSTELYLGDDDHYVKLTSDGFVVIKAYDGVNGAVWGFSPDGTTSIPGDIKSDSNINIDINLSDSTLRRWSFGEDGSLTLPSVGKINNGAYDWTFGSTGNTTFPTGLTLGAPRGVNTVNFTCAVDKEFQIETGTATSGKLWQFGTDGSLTIPGDIKSNSNINIDINLSDSTLRRWHFGEDGELTVPGPISGLGNAKLDFTTYGANVAYLTTTSDDTTALIMGTTSAELYAQTNILIRTNTDGTAKVWTFGDDGSLTLPNGSLIKDTDDDAVAFGQSAGLTNQDSLAVAIGRNAGTSNQSGRAVAIGNQSGNTSQGFAAVAIGSDAGNTSQGAYAVAIGQFAGTVNQGTNSIAIGYNAGLSGTFASSIILNASGSALNSAAAGFYVDPIRNISATSGVLQYNASTKEVSYSNSVTAETFNTDQITVVGNRISTTVTNANLEIECNGSGGVVINTLAEATTASTARSAGYLGIPASTVTTTNTLTIADAGEHIYVTTTGQTITIPAAASVAYPIGTTLTFIAGPSATTVTIAIASDTLRLAGGTSTGSRTLAANGMATAVKVASTTWYINGTGLT